MMYLELYFNTEELNILKGYIDYPLDKFNIKDINGKILIEGQDKDFDDLLDSISNLLMSQGIDSNGEINSFGVQLESIIDKISDIIY